MNAVSENLILTTNVRRDADCAYLIVTQIHDLLALNANDVVVGLGHYVVTNAFVNGRQTRDDAALLERIQCLVHGGDGYCWMELTDAMIDRVGAGMRVVAQQRTIDCQTLRRDVQARSLALFYEQFSLLVFVNLIHIQFH